MSKTLFIIMAIIAVILLFIASITATIGAGDAYSSSLYNKEAGIRTAHQYLTIAAVLGWIAVAILIIVLIIAAVNGAFNTVELSESFLQNPSPSKDDLIAAYREEKQLAAGNTTRIFVLIVLIIISLITLVVGILAAIAATDLGGIAQKDAKASSAYTMAVIAAISGIGGIGIMIVAVIAYLAIKSYRDKELAEVREFERKSEERLNVTILNR